MATPSSPQAFGNDLTDADMSQLYGTTKVAALGPFAAALKREGDAIASQFYQHLARQPGLERLGATLSGDERQEFCIQIVRDLLSQASEGLTLEQHRAAALRRGEVFTIAGMTGPEIMCVQRMLYSVVLRYVDLIQHAEALSIFVQRLMCEQVWQAQAKQIISASRDEILLRLTQLAWRTDNYADLIERATKIVGEHVEIAGCMFGRPDRQGKYRFEAISDANMEQYLNEVERADAGASFLKHERGQGPTGRAWSSGEIEYCLNFTTDERFAPWREIALRRGFRSCAAVPLGPPGQQPVAVLTLFNALRGGFAGVEQAAFLMHLEAVLVFALTQIESSAGRPDTLPYAQRQHWAMLLRSGALEMYYQPLLDLRSGRVTKVEALARLHDGEQVIAPAAFLPALSSDDLFELYVRGLDQALAQRRRWLQDGFDIGISINLPMHAPGETRYFDATREALQRHGCPGKALTLEILETGDTGADLDLPDGLKRFKTLGVKLAEDDLGSGYSGLSRLGELPFDTIKIDRSIVTLTRQDPSNTLRFIYQLTRLGHSLGKLVVVEGVEDTGLLEAIRMLGVDIVQGYVIAGPMASALLTPWIRSECLPDSVRPGPSTTGLGKLARLLILEESLHLHLDSPLRIRRPTQPAADGGVLYETGSWRDFVHPYLVDEFESVFPPGSAEHDAYHVLITTAICHGLRSAEYARVREHVVSAAILGTSH